MSLRVVQHALALLKVCCSVVLSLSIPAIVLAGCSKEDSIRLVERARAAEPAQWIAPDDSSRTWLTDDGHLALSVSVPRTMRQCVAAEPAVDCTDTDGDGLVDAWEDTALDRLRPMQRMTEAESHLDDQSARLVHLGRVLPAPDGDGVRAIVVLAWSRDYGRCGLGDHNGDSERVALDLRPLEGSPGAMVVTAAYTAGHEGTITDTGRVFRGRGLRHLEYVPDPARNDEPRWLVYSSESKHATYASAELCDGALTGPCFAETCARGADGGAQDHLAPIVNVGEQARPRITALESVGFAGDDAWAAQPFCGGRGGSGCTTPVVDKLVDDPFAS